jgi:signal transduction histidine kinase/ligand-binding sensor domain-containing protein
MQEEPRLRKTTVGVLIILTIVARRGLALDPHQAASSYLRTDFTIENGLPDNRVNVILQTRNGFLWVGTDAGLARFDGEHFTQIRFRAGISREIPVESLVTTPDGDLWVGTDAGLAFVPSAALDHFDRSLVKLYHLGIGLTDQIMCLYLSRKGVLYEGTNRGLYRLDHGRFVSVIPEEGISRIEEDSDGRLLIITSHGFVQWDGSKITRDPELADQLGVRTNEIYHVLEDHFGVTWFTTGAGLARRANGSIEKLTPYARSPSGPTYRIYEDSQGNLWVNKRSGMFRATATGLEPLVTGVNAKCMYSDLDGDLWVGTSADGLLRFKDAAIRMYTTADGLPLNYATTVLSSHDGGLWVGTNCAGISRFDGQSFKTYNEQNGLLNSCVYSMAEDSNHDVWTGTWGGGIFRFRDGHFTQYSTPQGLASKVALCILAARDGSLWIATPEGLSHMENEHFRNYTMADGLSSDRINTVYQDRSGGIWVGTSAGVDHLIGERFVPVRAEPESGNIPYGLIREDSSHNLYALSLVNGINHVENNRLISVNEAIEPSGMIESDAHDFWLGGRNGIFRVAAADLRREELDRGSPLDYTAFGRPDGLNSKECSPGQPNMAITSDGRLWVGTTKGLAMLDLRHMAHKNRKPAIFMEEVDVGREKRVPGRGFVLGPGTYHVELHFTAVDLASPENVRMQYRLDGVDPAWLDADSTRTAIYTYIPVGVHSFHIRATSGNGVWDRDGIVYNVTQQPYFYETGVFRVAALSAGLLLLAGLYRLRLRYAAASLSARFDERMAERTRIARDLHDTLLQSFHGLMFRMQAARNMLPRKPDEAGQSLDGAIAAAEQAIDEGRSAIQDLRSQAADQNDITESLTAMGQELATSQPVETNRAAFHITVEGERHALSPILQDEVYRIARELLRNAFQHAHATRIETEIRYDDRLFRLRIRDNGRGIDPRVLKEGKSAGHWGLPGIRERAKQIGAQLDLWSQLGVGTEVEMSLPASLAYAPSPDSRRFTLFRKKTGTHAH